MPGEVEAPATDPPGSTAILKSTNAHSSNLKIGGQGQEERIARVYETASAKGKVVSTEKTGAKLVVVEEAGKAVAKIGTAGKWLNVKATNGKRGFVDAGSVKVV